MNKVLVIGSINVDFIAFGERVPTPGETLLMDTYTKSIGGKGFNQALALKARNIDTRFQCCIGDDDLSLEIKKTLQKNEFHDIKVCKDSKCGVVFIGIDKQGQNTIMSCPNSNLHLTIDDVSDEIINWSDIVILQQEIAFNTVKDVLSKSKKNGKITIFNAAPAHSINYISPSDVDYLIVNEQEFLHILNLKVLDLDSIEKNFQYLAELGFNNIILTNGGKGIFYFIDKHYGFINSYKVKVLNTVGAGDTFIGVWTAYLLKSNDSILALKYANAAAAIMISQKQAMSDTILTEETILDFMKKNENGDIDE